MPGIVTVGDRSATPRGVSFTALSAAIRTRERQPAGGDGYLSPRLIDFSGGLDPTPGIKPAFVQTQDGQLIMNNTFRWNPGGYQTRKRGLCILPDAQTNQASVTNDEDVSSGNAANWRAFEVTTSLGGTSEVYYVAYGHKVYRRTTGGALEVAYTTTDEITCMGVLNVNGTARLVVATNGATDDVFYVDDPTGTWSGNTTVLIELSAGDYITAMRYFATVGLGVNVIVGQVGGTNGCWWMDTATAAPWTLEPLVLADTKDQEGALATVTLTDIDPTTGGNEGTGTKTGTTGTGPPGSPQTGAWEAAANIVSSNNGYAVWTVVDNGLNAEQGFETSWLHASGYDISSKPASGQFVAAEFTIEASLEDTSNLTSVYGEAQLVINGSVVGTPRSFGPLTGSDALYTVGSTTDNWDVTGLSGRFTIGLRIRFVGVAGDDGPSDVRVDHILLDDFVYRPLGDTVAFATGGWMETPDILRPNIMTIFVPTESEEATITKPRHGYELEITWDTGQARPLIASITPVPDGNFSVWHSAPFLKGHALVCGATNGPGKLLFLQIGDELYPLDWPGFDGQYDTRINSVTPVRDYLRLDLVMYDTDGTTVKDRQFCYWHDGKFYNDFIRQSHTNGLAIAAAPLARATVADNLADGLCYSFFPNGTDTAVVRVHQPADPNQDPRIVDTGVVKSMGWAAGAEDQLTYIYSQEMEVGESQDANTVLSALRHISSRRLSAATGAGFGSATLEVVTDGDLDFSGPEVSNEFTAALSEYLVPAYGQTGRTFAYRIGLTHDAGSAETPDGLGWLSKLVQEHDVEYSVDVVIDPKKMGEDFWSVLTALRDLFDNNPIQPLYLSNLSESSTVREVAVKGFRVQGVGWETPMVPGPLLVTDRTNVTLSFLLAERATGAAAS